MSGASVIDTYAYEEEEERRAMVRNLYVPMKQWYQSDNCVVLLHKYGPFPMFWQDLEKWENFKLILKFYMHLSDKEKLNERVNLSDLDLLLSGAREVGAETGAADTGPAATAAVDAPADMESKKRRRNRWGVGPEGESAVSAVAPAVTPPLHLAAEHDAAAKKKKSRWSVAAEPAVSTVAAATGLVAPMLSHEAIQQTMILQVQLKHVTEKIGSVVQDALIKEQDPSRSPSPPPRYDGNGKRTNTREMRMREALTLERTKIIEDLMKLNPLYQPPIDFVKIKPFKKVYIPVKEHPNYNFIGLIIGPRGNTQRRLEKDTGTKVSIRGKGSVKEGRKNQTKGPDDDDELHVHIQGETEEAVSLAVKLVNELLVPVDDEKNEHKQKQLRELALINGTLREDEFCQVCGERGHKQFECPHRSKTFKAANVKCAICGDQSHPTRDCPQKDSGPTNEIALDSEYNNFMAELDGGGAKRVETVPFDTVETSAAAQTETDAVVTTERILNGNKKQTIIHSKTVMTGWDATAVAPNIQGNHSSLYVAPTPSPAPQVSQEAWYAQYVTNPGSFGPSLPYGYNTYGTHVSPYAYQQYYDSSAYMFGAPGQVSGGEYMPPAQQSAPPAPPPVAELPPPPPPP